MRFYIIGFLFLTSCGLTPVKEPWADKFRGQEGYVQIAPKIIGWKEKNWANPTLFNQCKTVKIHDVVTNGTGNAFVLSQDGNLFYAWGSRDYLESFNKGKLGAEAAYLKPNLPGKSRTITLKSGKEKSGDLLCKGQIWTTMTPEELIFIKGQPERINNTTTQALHHDQWVYNKPGGGGFEYFYFYNGSLKSWQY